MQLQQILNKCRKVMGWFTSRITGLWNFTFSRNKARAPRLSEQLEHEAVPAKIQQATQQAPIPMNFLILSEESKVAVDKWLASDVSPSRQLHSIVIAEMELAKAAAFGQKKPSKPQSGLCYSWSYFCATESRVLRNLAKTVVDIMASLDEDWKNHKAKLFVQNLQPAPGIEQDYDMGINPIEGHEYPDYYSRANQIMEHLRKIYSLEVAGTYDAKSANVIIDNYITKSPEIDKIKRDAVEQVYQANERNNRIEATTNELDYRLKKLKKG